MRRLHSKACLMWGYKHCPHVYMFVQTTHHPCTCAHIPKCAQYVHTHAGCLRGHSVATASQPLVSSFPTSCSSSSWYLAVSRSSCRCFLTTSLLVAASRVVPMHLYRKFYNRDREHSKHDSWLIGYLCCHSAAAAASWHQLHG